MKDAIKAWILRAIALAVLGPLAAGLWTSLRAGDGSFHATPMLGADLVSGLFALAALGFVCVLAAGIGSTVLHRREGLLLAGLTLGWVAWASPDMSEVYASVSEDGVFVKLALEGAVVCLLVVLVMQAAMKASKRVGVEDPFVGAVNVLSVFRANAGKGVLIAGISCASVLAITWLQVQSGLSGQALWGAVIGGILAGLVSGFVGHSKGDAKISVLVPSMLGVALAGIVAPIATMLMVQSGGLERSIANLSVPGWAFVPSAAWACGAVFGAPIGYGAVLSSIEKHGGVATASA